MIAAIVYQERLSFLVRGPALIALALTLLAVLYAGWSGDRWRDARLQSLETFESEALASLADWRDDLAAIEQGKTDVSPFDANPMSILFPAVLPPASLADFAVGHADLHPASASISPWRNGANVFGRYQFDNPSMLAAAAFDVALVVIVVLPLLMIAVSFDVLAGDRARGSLAMVLATPVQLPRLVWTRLALRNGLIWVAAVAAMAVLYGINDAGGDRAARFGLWLGVSLAYGLFWFAVIALCVATVRSSIGTAATLVGLWLVLTLAAPATFATIAEALHPTPSRLAYLSDIRAAQGETNRNLASVTEGYLLDHPELSVGDEGLPSYFRAAYLSNEAARVSTRPVLAAYENARAGRERALDWAQYLSPAIVAQRLLALAAGGDLGRQHRFQAQVGGALAQLAGAVGPAVVSRNRLTVAQFDELRPFSFADEAAPAMFRRAFTPLAFVLALALIVGVVAHRRLATQRLHE